MLAEAKYIDNGILSIKNTHNFTNFNELDFNWSLTLNGDTIENGSENINLHPKEKKQVKIPFNKGLIKAPGEYFINISLNLKHDSPWENKGYQTAFKQVPLKMISEKTNFTPKQSELQINEEKDAYLVKGQKFSFKILKETGEITNYTFNGKEIITHGMKLNFFRAPTENDIKDFEGYKKWKDDGKLDELNAKAYNFEITKTEEIKKIVFNSSLFDEENIKSFDIISSLSLYPDGAFKIETRAMPTERVTAIAKVGYQHQLNSDFENISYFGRGPWENYSDRKTAGYIGKFKTKVDSLFVNYTVPQENGNRSEIRWVSMTDSENTGIMVKSEALFNTSAYFYTDSELTKAKHTYEISKNDKVTFNTDYLQSGLGTATCGPGKYPEYVIKPEEMHFVFTFIPFSEEKEDKLYQRNYQSEEIKFSETVKIIPSKEIFNEPIKIKLECEKNNADIYYTLDGSNPDTNAIKYEKPFNIDNSTIVNAISFKKGHKNFSVSKNFHYLISDNIYYNTPIKEGYTGGNPLALIDGVFGKPYQPKKKWVGFDDDAEITIPLNRKADIHKVYINFLQDIWAIYLPSKVEVLVSEDGENFDLAAEFSPDVEKARKRNEIFSKKIELDINRNNISAIKIKAKSYGKIKEGNNRNHIAYIFIDEVWFE
jgi:beta-galactosidase